MYLKVGREFIKDERRYCGDVVVWVVSQIVNDHLLVVLCAHWGYVNVYVWVCFSNFVSLVKGVLERSWNNSRDIH